MNRKSDFQEIEDLEILDKNSNFSQIPNQYYVLIRHNEIVAVSQSKLDIENFVASLLAEQSILPKNLIEFSVCQKLCLKFGVNIS